MVLSTSELLNMLIDHIPISPHNYNILIYLIFYLTFSFMSTPLKMIGDGICTMRNSLFCKLGLFFLSLPESKAIFWRP